MYSKLPNLVLGFHGCKRDVFEKVLQGKEQLKSSSNTYDWLGNGIYFWEQNFDRAKEWAEARYGEDNAAVLGAVLDLGYCLNLTDSAGSARLKLGYELLKLRCEIAGVKLPQNRALKGSADVLIRDLDCAVIEQIHDYNRQAKKMEYDSVRGIFTEGEHPYPGSEFFEKTHVQLCIRNTNCIKGYFKPLKENPNFKMP